MNSQTYKSSIKSTDTEEWWDMHFTRPLGYYLALGYKKIQISPNNVTIISIIIGIVAGICFYPNQIGINAVGMLLLIIANLHDSADGQLARMTHQCSRIGRILDGLAGDCWFITIYIALCLRLSTTFPTIWILASIAGISHILQAAMADYYRNIHLLFLYGKRKSEVDNSKEISKKLKSIRFTEHPIQTIILFFYRNYTRTQEICSPSLQKLLHRLKEKYGENFPQQLSSSFRAKNRHLMKYTNILTFNTRMGILFITLFLERPQYYFLIEVTLFNIILLYMIFKQEKISRYFYRKEQRDV